MVISDTDIQVNRAMVVIVDTDIQVNRAMVVIVKLSK